MSIKQITVRGDLTIHTVEMIDEVLRLALEENKDKEMLATPKIRSTDSALVNISATIK